MLRRLARRQWLAPGAVLRQALAVVVAAQFAVAAARASEVNAVEYGVKGAFLVKFGMFVEWPTGTFSETQSVFRIGILGDDPFGPEFEAAAQKEKIAGRTVEIRRGRRPEELKDCQIVFLSAAESARLAEWIAALGEKGILLVADAPEFVARGGMIGFIKEEGKIRFEINPAAAERAGLKISSKLLQVGKRVNRVETVAG